MQDENDNLDKAITIQEQENKIQQLEKEIENLKQSNDKKPKRKKKGRKKRHVNALRWFLTIFFITIVLAFIFSFSIEMLSPHLNLVWSFVILLVLLAIAFVCDILAIAVTTCKLPPILAMNSRKVKGAKQALYLAKNAEKIANIFSDVVGDICGIISGVLAATIVIQILLAAPSLDGHELYVAIALTCLIAAVTVGGKALVKIFAIRNSNSIVFFAGRLMHFFRIMR
ncbi:MAG: hypothetical protein FWB72_03990 [Firmicutes bacterium]|nr:hypothetical protein [Bacillota bacterium]